MLENGPDFVWHYGSRFCVAIVVCESVRDDSASKASGCCVVFYVRTLKKKYG